jgi:Flp pilus assembly pilin Flp
MKKLKKLWKDESGLEIIEYSVLGALIIVGLVALFPPLKAAILAVWNAITNALTSAMA